MSDTKHTPGPWKAHMNVSNATIEGHIIKADHGVERPVASLWKGGGTSGVPTQEANARLIAAAPELLEACHALLAITDDTTAEQGEIFRAEAHAAIAKAEGTETVNET